MALICRDLRRFACSRFSLSLPFPLSGCARDASPFSPVRSIYLPIRPSLPTLSVSLFLSLSLSVTPLAPVARLPRLARFFVPTNPFRSISIFTHRLRVCVQSYAARNEWPRKVIVALRITIDAYPFVLTFLASPRYTTCAWFRSRAFGGSQSPFLVKKTTRKSISTPLYRTECYSILQLRVTYELTRHRENAFQRKSFKICSSSWNYESDARRFKRDRSFPRS